MDQIDIYIMIKAKIWIVSTLLLLTFFSSAQHPAEFMYQRKWGVMHHFLADFYQAENPDKWNRLVDEFDVKALANQLDSVHAGWVIFTIGQNSGYYCSPNSVYDKAMNYPQSHCSKRDLIADLADALNEKGIPLIAYIPFGFKILMHLKIGGMPIWFGNIRCVGATKLKDGGLMVITAALNIFR